MSMTDRLKSALEAFVRRLVSRYDYAFAYSYTVESQNDDYTLELKPNQPKLAPSLSAVEILWSDPAHRCKVKRGAQTFVMFPDGSPANRFAFGFKHGDFESVSIGENVSPIARLGDLVESGGPGTYVMLIPLPGNVSPSVLPGVPYLVGFASVADPEFEVTLVAQGPLQGGIFSASDVAGVQ